MKDSLFLLISDEPLRYLGYKSTVSEILETTNGSDFSPNCARSYTDEADVKTNTMMVAISNALAGSGCGDTVTSVTYLSSFTTAGKMVSFRGTVVGGGL